MKISTVVSLFLVIAVFMIVFGLMSQEAKTYYPESNINDSDWYGKYDYSSGINDSTYKIKNAFDSIGDDKLGWWSKIGLGIVALPQAIIAVPVLLFKTLVFGETITNGFLTTLMIPATIIVIIIIMMLVWGIMKLIEVYQRWQI